MCHEHVSSPHHEHVPFRPTITWLFAIRLSRRLLVIPSSSATRNGASKYSVHGQETRFEFADEGLRDSMKFSEVVRLLEQNGFKLVREKGSIRYYAKPGVDRLIRVDYHGPKEVPTGPVMLLSKLRA